MKIALILIRGDYWLMQCVYIFVRGHC